LAAHCRLINPSTRQTFDLSRHILCQFVNLLITRFVDICINSLIYQFVKSSIFWFIDSVFFSLIHGFINPSDCLAVDTYDCWLL
jgi:hypothetical protein